MITSCVIVRLFIIFICNFFYFYNLQPPVVKCLTKLWHPNINLDGEVCLSILRQSSIDGMGWAPTRKLKDVVWGLNSLFTVSTFASINHLFKFIKDINQDLFIIFFVQDLLNFDDPLNKDAADLFLNNKESFRNKAHEYVLQYAKR